MSNMPTSIRTAIIVKIVIAASFLILAVLVVLSGIVPNLGLPFGYYGDLNRTVAILRRVPGVQITGTRVNHDVTLEECSIDMTIGGVPASMYFPDPEARWSDSLRRATVLILQCRDQTPNPRRLCWPFDLAAPSRKELEGVNTLLQALARFDELLTLAKNSTPVDCAALPAPTWDLAVAQSVAVPCSSVLPD